jgi:hypothetical protein
MSGRRGTDRARALTDVTIVVALDEEYKHAGVVISGDGGAGVGRGGRASAVEGAGVVRDDSDATLDGDGEGIDASNEPDEQVLW